jgi:LysM repeat protein/FtsZ-binding cell division protein ZapB
MLPRIFWLIAAIVAVPAVSAQVEVANLREDVRGLTQRVGELALRIEQLERENAALRQASQGMNQTYVTLTQLNSAVADLNLAIRSAVANSKNETLQQVGVQMEKMAKVTNTAIESVAKGMATRPVVQAVFSEDYSKEGVSYTVQKGDTIAEIAKKTGAKQQDIINANKISDPSRIVVGQTLFIPGGK